MARIPRTNRPLSSMSRASWFPALLLPVLFPLFIHLDTTLWGSEARWLCAASAMRTTGNYLEPELHGEFYGDKPLLSYWAIVLASLPFGHVDERVSRLPSAMAGALTVLLTAWIACHLFGRRSALLSGWVLATSFSFYFWSRSASADLINLAFTTAAVFVYLKWRSSPKPWHPLLFFNLLAVGGHAKGMPAVLVPLGIVSADLLLRPSLWKSLLLSRDRRGSLRRAFPLGNPGWIAAGALSGTLVYALPFLASYAARGDWQLLSFMWRENFVRALDAFDHQGSVFHYAATLPEMFLPWSPWLLGALGWSWKRFRAHPGFRLSLISFLVIFLLFTASQSRRSYYILPIFPFAAILVAAYFDEMILLWEAGVPLKKAWSVLLFFPFVLLAGALSLGVVFLASRPFLPAPGREAWEALPYRGLCAAGALILVAGLFWAYRRRSLRHAIAAAVLAAFLGALYYATGGEDLREKSRIEPAFAREVKEKFPGLKFVYYRPNSRLRYYLGPGRDAGSGEALREIINESKGETFVVLHQENLTGINRFLSGEVTEILRVSAPRIGPVESRTGYSLLKVSRP